MRRLFTIDMQDYEESWPRRLRPSVRGIIIKNGKPAMVYSCKFDYYKFPGGGIESNEDHTAALKREILEETGLIVDEASIKEYGSVRRIQKSRFAENEIFDQENFYYLCEVSDSISAQSLDEYEYDEGFELRYISAKDAIIVNRLNYHKDYDLILIERESRVLETLIKEGIL